MWIATFWWCIIMLSNQYCDAIKLRDKSVRLNREIRNGTYLAWELNLRKYGVLYWLKNRISAPPDYFAVLILNLVKKEY